MPMYDFRCETCHREWEQLMPVGKNPPCHECGTADVVKLWKKRPSAIKGDEIPGGMWIENLGHEPVKVYSHTERLQLAEQRGLQEYVKHVPVPGTDKSPHTTNWAVMSPEGMEKAKQLLERVGRPTQDFSVDPGPAIDASIRNHNPDKRPARMEEGRLIDPDGELL